MTDLIAPPVEWRCEVESLNAHSRRRHAGRTVLADGAESDASPKSLERAASVAVRNGRRGTARSRHGRLPQHRSTLPSTIAGLGPCPQSETRDKQRIGEAHQHQCHSTSPKTGPNPPCHDMSLRPRRGSYMPTPFPPSRNSASGQLRRSRNRRAKS